MGRTQDNEAATQPLAGLTVLVTRTREQAEALVSPLEALGAEVVAFPVIEVVDPDDPEPLRTAPDRIAGYDWLVLTSTNGVDRFLAVVPAELLEGVRVAAVGSATAGALRRHGIEPDIVPRDYRAEGLLESFRTAGVGGGTRILIARAMEAREVLPEALREMGAEVDVLVVYKVVPAVASPDVLARLNEGAIDVATFASGGTARHFVELIRASGLDPDRVMSQLCVASVGPVTTEGIVRIGYGVDIEAQESTMESLVDAIVEHYRRDAE